MAGKFVNRYAGYEEFVLVFISHNPMRIIGIMTTVLLEEGDFIWGRVDAMYIKIIIIPPRKARIKIREIQGLLVWTHFSTINLKVSIRTAGIKRVPTTLTKIPQDTNVKIANVIIQSLV